LALERNQHFQKLFDDNEIVWMGQNTNHIVPRETIVGAINDCLQTEEYHKYPPPLGLAELRELIVHDLGLTTDVAYVTSGSVESLYEIAKVLLKSGDEVITTDPGWLTFLQFVQQFGSKGVTIPIYDQSINYKLTPELFARHITSRTKLLYLVDPNNPLGSAYTREEIKAFHEIAIDHDIYFVHDCTYRDFADSHFPVLRLGGENSIVTYSFSKAFGLAGLRLGAIVANEELISKFAQVQINPFGVNIMSQRAGTAALRSKSSWMGELRQKVRLHQKMVKDAVDSIPSAFIPVYPSQANFVAVDVKGTGLRPEEICWKLFEKKFYIRQGAYQSRLFGDRFVKISLTVPTDDVTRFCQLFPNVPELIRKEGASGGQLY
jgi:aspartate/methionine/tyrosine aminotransferase